MFDNRLRKTPCGGYPFSMRIHSVRALSLIWILGASIFLSSCSIFHQPGEASAPILSRIFKTDYNTAWQAVLDAMKDLDRTVVNREAGVVQTAWIENTDRKVSSEVYADSETYMKAKYRLTVTVSPGNFKSHAAVKVSIQKEQLLQRDIMEGWNSVPSDSVEENTFLYRVGRVVFIKEKLKRMEEERTRRAFEEGA